MNPIRTLAVYRNGAKTMKDMRIHILLAAFVAGTSILIARQPTNAPENGAATAPVPATNGQAAGQGGAAPAAPATAAAGQIPQPPPQQPATQDKALAAADTQQPVSATAPTEAADASANTPAEAGTNALRMNFRNAPLDRVLNYMSEAAGFIIVLEARPRGTVDVWSNTPVSKDEAVNLLNQALRKNGYAAIRNGRTLTVVPRDEAKIHDIPVHVGGDPDAIPRTDEVVTQIIPVRFVEVAQLVKDLQPLVSTQTTMTANESGNEIVITDTQANIRKVAEIIKAIDAGAEDVTVVRVFRLAYADPTELSELLVNLFPDDSRSGGSSSPVAFGGLRSFFRGGGPGGGRTGGAPSAGSSNNQNQRIKKRARVVAVPDPRTSSVAVSAARDLMDQIEGVVAELDSNPAKVKKVRVIKVENADVQQVMQVLQDSFQNQGQNNNRNANQNSALSTRSSQQSGSQTTTTGTRTGGSRGGGIGGGGSFGP
jgi:general secretion pathway protein D